MRQRGQALLIAVLLIVAVAALGAIVAGSISSSDVTDSSVQGTSVEALYTAESGVGRALKQFTTGTACASLGGSDTVVAGRTFTTTAKGSTDFDGASALPNSQCRVEVSGSVAGVGSMTMTRRLQGVLDRNLLAGEAPGFNDTPNLWANTGRWDTTGGPDPTGVAPPNCTRALYVVKPRQAAGVISSGTATMAIVPNATGTTGNVTVRFNYRATEVASVNNNTCATDALAAVCPGAAADVMVCFSLDGGATFTTFSTTASTASIGPAVTGPACNPTTVSNPGAYASCASRYQQGTATAKAQVLVAAPAGGTISSIQVKIYLRAAGPAREVWVDNIELINNAGVGIARVLWRDCSVMGCV